MDSVSPRYAVDPVALARSLVDIDSTTGREGEVGASGSRSSSQRGYQVTEQPVTDGRFNVFAGSTRRRTWSSPRISTACRRSFRAARSAGCCSAAASCDAKGILAAQVAAAERLRAAGETRIALLFVVGEERGSDGARVANDSAPDGVRYLINGEPTDNRLGAATRGILRVRLHADGRAAHSSFPELGESAIDKLLDALMVLRGVALPDDPLLGRTHYTVGLIEGGVAPNVVSPHASAELLVPNRGRVAMPSARRCTSSKSLVSDRAGARHPGRADAHRAGLRDRGVSVHDRRAAADALGHSRC